LLGIPEAVVRFSTRMAHGSPEARACPHRIKSNLVI
jgi:hypothetical protein